LGLQVENTEFFQNVLSYLENRVQMVDNRSNIFLALVIGLLVAYGYITREFFFNTGRYVFLGVHTILSLSSCLLFLQTIRPSRYFFWGRAAPEQLACEKYLFWPEHNPNIERMLKNDEEFKKCFQSFTSQDIFDNYQRAVNAELKIVRAKYRFYRNAVMLLKLLIVLDIIALMVLPTVQRSRS